MTSPGVARHAIRELLRSPRATSALTTTGAGLVAFAFTTQQLIGWPGYTAALILLDVLLVASLVARRDEVEWHWTTLPISLIAYLFWTAISVFWSGYPRATLLSVSYLVLISLIGVFIALSRDTIQIIRGIGDVLRAVLLSSLLVEVLSGIIFDAPLKALNVVGRIAEGGPISGLVSTRNQLGLIAAIALITFLIEWRTKSIGRWVAIPSLAMAALTIAFTRSPVVAMVVVLLGAATAVLYGIRRLREDRRQIAQYATLGLLVGGAIAAWILRGPIIAIFNATGELEFRLALWQQVLDLVELHGIEGWGWLGIWDSAISPYAALTPTNGRPHASALNAIVDLWLQTGLVGVLLFLATVGLAFTRSWLLAGRRRSVIYTWPALVLVTLVGVSVAESAALVEFGWLLLVICCVKASAELSWRSALSRQPGAPEGEAPGRGSAA